MRIAHTFKLAKRRCFFFFSHTSLMRKVNSVLLSYSVTVMKIV